MADSPVTSTNLGSSGANVLMRYLATQFVKAGRNFGSPIKFCMDVSEAVAQRGQKVGVPVAPTITSATLADGSSHTLDDTSPTTVDITLNKPREVVFGITQVADALDGGFSREMFIQSRIAGLLNGVETDVMSAVTAGFTTNVVGTYNSAITAANIDAAVQALDGYLCPQDGRIGLVHHSANAWGALSNLAGFEQYQYTGEISPNVSIMNGQGRLYKGIRWFKSQAMPKATNNVDNLVFNPAALVVAFRPLPIPSASLGVDAQNFYDEESGVVFQILHQWNRATGAEEFVVKTLYGYGVVKETWGCLFKS